MARVVKADAVSLSLFVVSALSVLYASAELQVKSEAKGGVFTVGETPSVFLSQSKDGVTWSLLDWRRQELRHGAWSKGERLVFEGLPQGYYYVVAKCAETKLRDCTFCIVADPARRSFPSDSFYGVDAALSWVSSPQCYAVNWYGTNSYAASLDLIRLCGLPHVRERLTWGEVSPRPGEYDWGRYLANARFAQERGILLSGVFHDAPKFARRNGGKGPPDPAAIYCFCRDAGRAFGKAMGDWEFWNEPDISFWAEPAWDFMSAMKAAYLGFKAADAETPVLNGAMSDLLKGSMSETLFENDLAKYSNVLNCHSYGPPAGWADYFDGVRRYKDRFGLTDRQVWFTESSTNLEGDSVGEGLTPGFKAHSYEQELVLSELYAKNSIYLQMQGLARNYFFVFGPYNERNGTKDWGVQRRDGSVKLVYSAIATMTEHLVAAKLEGEMNVGDGVKCYVFRQPDGSQSVACWSVSPVDTTKSKTATVHERQLEDLDGVFELTVPDGDYSCANWCGERSVRTVRDGKLSVRTSRYVTFIDGLCGLVADLPARSVGKIESYRPAADEDLSVVMGIEFAKRDFVVMKGEAGLDGERGQVTLRLWNFSDGAKRGRVRVENCELEGLPPEIQLPPGGQEVALEATLRITDWSNAVTRLTVTGTFDGKRTSRLFVPVRCDKMMREGYEVVPVAATEVGFWKRHDSASETRITWDEKELALRFDLEWKDPKTDRWFYPQHVFLNRQESFDDADYLDFEARMVSNKMENDVLCANCVLFRQGEKIRYCEFEPPTDFWEKRRVSLTNARGESLGHGKDGFGLGFNPYATKVTFWLRNMRLYRKKRR